MICQEIPKAEMCLSALASNLLIRALTKAFITAGNERAPSSLSVSGQFLTLRGLSKVGS
jgi:hypothetical protein